MKAIVLKEAGGVENLIITDIAIPQPQPQEVVIQVAAVSINPVDIKTRKGGGLLAKMQESGAAILGWDISGTITAIGNAVQQLKVGDEVFGMINFPGHGKAYAQYVAAPETHLTLKPQNLTHQEAAAATLAALTAWQVLVQQAKVQAGQKVLIHAAAGGVGHFAVQIAKHLGAYVIGTASAANAAFLKELGVDQPIDYTKQPIEEVVQDADVILDPLGGETTIHSLGCLKEGGTLISIVGGVKEALQPLIFQKKIHAANYLVHSSGEDMSQLASLLQQGVIKPFVSQQFSFEQMAAAHTQIETGKTKGKIVVNWL